MQVDKSPLLVHMAEAVDSTILIRPEQANKAQGKNVIIGEPCVAPNV